MCCDGTGIQSSAKFTIFPASIKPYPNLWLTFRCTPLTIQPLSFSNGSAFDVNTTKNCKSRQVSAGFACRANAHMPAANGADADVPVCSTVQIRSGRNLPSMSTVATLLSWPGVPELYVVANVDEHSSKYHGLNLYISKQGKFFVLIIFSHHCEEKGMIF